MNNQVYILFKSSNNLDLGHTSNMDIVGVFSSYDLAQKNQEINNQNIIYKYYIKGPYIIDSTLFKTNIFKPIPRDINMPDTNFGMPDIDMPNINPLDGSKPFKKPKLF